jgi:dihydrodipicolinate synthase/N-acetylneuraminate lyase
VPPALVERLRARAPNLAGLKVSDTPWERLEPYVLGGLDVLVGPEALIERGLAAGAVGAVSGLAAAFPEVVAAVVRAPTADGAAEAGALRDAVQRFPLHAALKHVLGRRGVPVQADVRAPLRQLDEGERRALDSVLAGVRPRTKMVKDL